MIRADTNHFRIRESMSELVVAEVFPVLRDLENINLTLDEHFLDGP